MAVQSVLQSLDAMGAINLERITRDQVPDIRIDRCIALFFCPYEDLPHTYAFRAFSLLFVCVFCGFQVGLRPCERCGDDGAAVY
jgi:hypothetical protein